MAGRETEDSNSMEFSEEEGNYVDERGGKGWEEVVKRRKNRNAGKFKRKKNMGSLSETENEGGESERKNPKAGVLSVVLRFEGEGGVKKTDPLKLTKIIRGQIGEVNHAKVLGDGNLLIGCSSEEQVVKAKKMTCIGKIKVFKVVRVGEQRINGSKGVISGVPLNVSMRELMENLKVREGSVKSVIRMTRGIEKMETETVLVEFGGKEIPKEVYCGFVRYNVREYIPKPMRCFNCQEFGHIAKVCKGKRKCARCGGDHEYGKCGEGVSPKCSNCGGNHSVAYWGCEVLKKEVEVQQIRVKEKISYAEAVKMVGENKKHKEGGCSKEQVVGRKQQDEKAWVEKRKMVTFIAGVINATYEIKSKTERIQVIVKAAVHHLDMIGLRWEEVRDELSIQSSQETACVGC